jgi:hypothetical protein
MAFYLVTARPRPARLDELRELLGRGEFAALRPFGRTLTSSLRNARLRPDGAAVWEEEDYCSPPLAQEREAVLDRFFDNLEVEPVREDAGWRQITDLPPLFPQFAERGSRPGE